MRYLPIHVDTKDARILIVGGEGAAEAKLRTLIKTDAKLNVVAPEISPEILRWAEQGLLTHMKRDFEPSDLKGVRLVYAATEDDALNLEIGDLARAQGLLVNAADQKDACDFITPALVDRSPVIVSIGTEGTSPSELLDEVRHERALALLEEGQHSLDEIAYELGFSGAGAFRRAFRRWTGVTPTEYVPPR